MPLPVRMVRLALGKASHVSCTFLPHFHLPSTAFPLSLLSPASPLSRAAGREWVLPAAALQSEVS